jgi:hypothetical protein
MSFLDKKISLSSRHVRRVMFGGVNLLLAVSVYFLLVEPVRSYLAERAESVADRRSSLARYEAVVAQDEAVRLYESQVADGNAQGDLLSGASEGVVNANLQARLKALAQQAAVNVRSIRMLPAKTANGVTLVGARLEVDGGLESLHALARALEGESPLLIVLSASLRNETPVWSVQSGPEASIGAQFDVYGGASTRERS